MPKLLHSTGFIPIHQKEIRRPCGKCGKWIYVVNLGFCRYRFDEYNYSIEQNISTLPWTAVLRIGTNHICIKGSFRMNDDIKRNNGRIITRMQNHDQLHNRRQNNENRVRYTNIQRQNDRHELKSTFEGI
jgi:hypothetical protein